MKKKSIIIVTFLLSFSVLAGAIIASAKTSDEIIFKDKNLKDALSKYYDFKGVITEVAADELSDTENNVLVLDNAKISDLEGLQYFDNLTVIYLRGNSLNNLKPLSNIKSLFCIDFSNNSIKGKGFMDTLNVMGKIKGLEYVTLNNNGIYDINILDKIGYLKNYKELRMEDNKINDISILKNASNLETLNLSNNRITDVSPLKNLKNFKYWLDLRDNCIIDYRPVKSILDEIYEEGGWENVISRYDYYTNPVDIGVNGNTIKFPYLTVYYKYQPYVEAIPLFEALGGSAEYIKGAGILICRYKDKVIGLADFSDRYIINGEVKSIDYPMRRMQYDLAYVPVIDICEALGLKYNVTEEREIFENEDEGFYVPKYVEISVD